MDAQKKLLTAMMLTNLALTLQRRFAWTGHQSDLDQAIEAARSGVRATPADDPELPDRLHVLGDLLWIRYQRTDDPGDLDALITAFTSAVAASTAEHSDRAEYLSKLGILLRKRYQATGSGADLDAAVEAGEASVRAVTAGEAERAGSLNNLGNALRARFDHAGAPADLDAAIEVFTRASRIPATDEVDRAKRLGNLGNALLARFGHSSGPADLDAAITALEGSVAALPFGHHGETVMLTDLRGALRMRFARTGRESDLAAVSEVDQAIRETAPAAVELLGSAMKSTNLNAISAALDAWRDIVAATPPGHRDHAGFSNNLALVLRMRHERTGAPADLDEAVDVLGEAARNAPEDDPETRAMSLSNLGNALRRRFERTGARADVDAAVQAGEAAVANTPAGSALWAGHTNNLGNALRARFERTRDRADLDRAIELRRAALDAVPDGHRDRAAALTNLGTSLLIRFEHTGDQADLTAAVEAARAACETDHPGRTTSYGLLGDTLTAQSRHTGESADLDAAIEAVRTAVDALPANHPDRASSLVKLATARRRRWQENGAAADREAALSAFAQAAELATAPPSIRIHAAEEAAWMAAPSEPGRAAALLETAVLLLPQVAPRRLAREDQQHALSLQAGLAPDAAALALADPGTPAEQRPARALRLLEAGRAVLLSQLLATRSDLSDLRERHPGVAERFVQLRELLDQHPPAGEPDPGAPDRHQSAQEFDDTLAEIRALPGFASFALPPTVEELLGEAAAGPVVMLNVSRYRSDALLLTSDGISSVELPGLGADQVEEVVNVFRLALRVASAPDAPYPLRRDAQNRLEAVLQWLWEVAAGPVLHALGHDDSRPARAGPRVWWVPGGLLGLLPLHAAGYHDDPPDAPGRRTVIDRVVSSYTPTIGALRHARQRTRPPDPAQQALIVAMPTTPGVAGRLRSVPDEVAVLRTHLPEAVLLIEPDPAEGPPAADEHLPTKANVLARLSGSAIAHFACHGAGHPSDPSRSLLLLHDHESAPLTVASLAAVDLAGAQLAYLSACRTAISTAPGFFDEAVHLTSAFQLAGFPQVVGTLWEINDTLAATVADWFYGALQAESGEVDPGRAAHALHHAVRLARDRFPRTPSLWAAYLHAGG